MHKSDETLAALTLHSTSLYNAVNFIWMGNFLSDKKLTKEQKISCCEGGPKSLATVSPETKINMWVPDSLVVDAKLLFEDFTSINVLSVDKLLNGEYGKLQDISKIENGYDLVLMLEDNFNELDKNTFKTPFLVRDNALNYQFWYKDETWKFINILKDELNLPNDLFSNEPKVVRIEPHFPQYKMFKRGYIPYRDIDRASAIKKALITMNEAGSFVAQKDLLSFVVIAEFGGIFSDTTVIFTEKPILSPINDIKVALEFHEGWYDYYETQRAKQKGLNSSPIWNERCDIWAFASSKPNHPVFMGTLDLILKHFEKKTWVDTATTLANIEFIRMLIKEYGMCPEFSKVIDLCWRKQFDSKQLLWKVSDLNMEKYIIKSWSPDRNEQNAKSYNIFKQRTELVIKTKQPFYQPSVTSLISSSMAKSCIINKPAMNKDSLLENNYSDEMTNNKKASEELKQKINF